MASGFDPRCGRAPRISALGLRSPGESFFDQFPRESKFIMRHAFVFRQRHDLAMELPVDETTQAHFIWGPLIRHKGNMYLFERRANRMQMLLVFGVWIFHAASVLS